MGTKGCDLKRPRHVCKRGKSKNSTAPTSYSRGTGSVRECMILESSVDNDLSRTERVWSRKSVDHGTWALVVGTGLRR